MTYPGLFKKRYAKLAGADWIRRVDPDDRKAFARIGMENHDYGRLGGKARVQTAKRDSKGRFVCANT